MDSVRYAGKTELARNTRRIIREVQQGQTVVIEHHGEPEVAILDITDYYLLRASLRFHTQPPAVTVGGGLTEADVDGLPNREAQTDRVLAHLLAGDISLARAAELLGIPWLDLRTRMQRLEIPHQVTPVNPEAARADAARALDWANGDG